ncbi:MAG: DUF2007 domain-containing protein [Candidatus Latescibacteria bacterium]|jgi:hypothetical protein|nr:DUF2007 domain-containing protein [Candidatus Latescibacterota bacterium]
MEQNEAFVKVLSVGDPFRIALAKSLLDEAGIPYLSQGEPLQEMIGAGRFGGYNIAVGPIEIFVDAENADKARALLEDLEGDGDSGPDREEEDGEPSEGEEA